MYATIMVQFYDRETMKTAGLKPTINYCIRNANINLTVYLSEWTCKLIFYYILLPLIIYLNTAYVETNQLFILTYIKH